MNTDDVSEYEGIVEKRWDYYRPRFERFARGGWLSWNWAACFGTLAWLRYRGLHAWSWAYFFVSTPVLLSLLLVYWSSSDGCEKALDPGPGHIVDLTTLTLVAAGWLLLPLFANRLYYNHARRRLHKADGATRTGGWIGALALQAFVLVGIAVTVPSYGNYRSRAMVSEGLSLGAGAKTSMEEHLANTGKLPARIEDVTDNVSGKYVGQLTIEADGTIRAIFGDGGRKLAGRSVSIVPEMKDGRIVNWVCRSDDLPDRCLPAACRRR